MPPCTPIALMIKRLLSFACLSILGLCTLPAQQMGGGSPAAGGAVDPAMKSSHARRPVQTGPRVVNRIAATVNGRSVTSSELAFMLMPAAAQLAAQYPRQGPEFAKQLSQAKNKILDELIDRELVLGEFDERGFMFPDSIIDQELERTIRENFGGDREKFLADLRQAGLTIRGFRDITKRRLIVMSMRSQKYDMDIPPTPEEIRQEYSKTKSNYRDISKDKITFEKIFIPLGAPGTDEGDPDYQLSYAELVADQIKTGKKTFADAAKEYSRDEHAEKGGQWPQVTRGELAAEFAAIAFDAPVNTVIGPLADPYGFTIVRVQKKELAPPPPLEKVKAMVDDQVRRIKSAVRYERWINRLREQAIIKKFI